MRSPDADNSDGPDTDVGAVDVALAKWQPAPMTMPRERRPDRAARSLVALVRESLFAAVVRPLVGQAVDRDEVPSTMAWASRAARLAAACTSSAGAAGRSTLSRT